MAKEKVVLTPYSINLVKQFGEQIKLARYRRKIPTQVICDRAGISRATLWKIEKGNPNVLFASIVAVLHAINNSDKEILNVLSDDEIGRTYQDLSLKVPKRINK